MSGQSATRDDELSIYEHVRAHIPAEGPGLLPEGQRLPDEPPVEPGEITVTWAPGLKDEIRELGSVESSEQRAAQMFRLLEAAARSPSDPDRYGVLYEDLRSDTLLGFLDPLIRRVYGSGLPRKAVRNLALRMVTGSSDRMPVKVGIALLGLCAKNEDRAVLLTLGRHEEFTNFVGAAFTNAFQDPEPALWELAKVVEMWGRIALVRQLASTTNKEIKSWILREGYQGFLVEHELAYVAATTGELVEALRSDEIDDRLCLGAGRILLTLIDRRPYPQSEDIDDYEDGPEAIKLFLAHVARKEERLENFEPIARIVEFLELRDGDDSRFQERWRSERPLPAGWSDEERERTATFGRWILQRPAWRGHIDDGLASPDGRIFQMAEWAARWLGDDTFPVILARLRRPPADDETGWWEATILATDEARWNELLDVALERLLRHETDAGPRFARWMIYLTQEIERFPGTGWPLFRAALESPVMMERRFGIRGLWWFLEEGWSWPTDADDLLEVVAGSDPDQETRGWATELLEEAQGPGRVTTP